MELKEITRLIETQQSQLLADSKDSLTFRICEVLCHLNRNGSGVRYYVKFLMPQEFASLSEMAAAIHASHHSDTIPFQSCH